MEEKEADGDASASFLEILSGEAETYINRDWRVWTGKPSAQLFLNNFF
jgi:hypothetical protein